MKNTNKDYDIKGCRKIAAASIALAVFDYKKLSELGFIKNFKSTKKLARYQQLYRDKKLDCVTCPKRRLKIKLSNPKIFGYYSKELDIDHLCHFFTSGYFKEFCSYLGIFPDLKKVDSINIGEYEEISKQL